MARHRLEAVDGWNDMGLGKFELGYLRDKEVHEVDSQIVLDADYVDADCFARPGGPPMVPARTFLFQLM